MTPTDGNDAPVNLDNVRDMLGNDPAREKELFRIFIESCEEALSGMKASCGAGAEENWRTQAHAMKGMSLNLGAAKLGELCAIAQQSQAAVQADKENLLAAIQEEYAKVKAFLQGQ